MTLRESLRDTAPGTPIVVLIGDQLALTGTYKAGTAGDLDDGTIAFVTLSVPPCTCPVPDRDVDPGCVRCYSRPPAHLFESVAKAVAASRHWSYPAGISPHIDGCTDLDVNAAQAVLDVLLNPTRHGVFQ